MMALNRPVIIGISDTLELSSNGTLILTCRGKRKLFWETQKSTWVSEKYEDLDQYMTPKKEERWTLGEYYFLKLTLTGIQYYDTGRYICRYLKDSERQISVYVFVTNTSAFLPNKKEGGIFMVRRYFRNEPLVLPCQTTLVNVNVTLTKNGSSWTPRSSNHSISYDQTVGFTIWALDDDMEARYTCEAKIGPETESVLVEVLDPGNFYPVIMNATEPYVTVPDSFDEMKLVCIGAREVTWVLPSYLPPQTREYVRQGPVIPWNKHYLRELTISEHRSDLTGFYTCRDLQMRKAKESLLLDQSSTVFLLFPDDENFMYPVLGKLKAKISLGIINTYYACVRTTLDVSMYFYKVTKEETKLIKNTETMWLDPTKGLVIDTRQPRNYSFLEGTYKCLAVTMKGEKRTRLIHLSVDRREKRLTIIPKEKTLLKRGQDLYLTCYLNIKKEYQTRIIWKYPFHSSRVLEYNTEEVKEDGVLLGYSRQLVVRRVETTDKGTYSCQARSPDGFLYTENYYLNFNDPSSVELELLQDTFNGNDTLVKDALDLNNYIIYSRRGSTVKLAVRIKLTGQTIKTQIAWYQEQRVGLLLLPGKNVGISSNQNWSNLTLTDLQDEMVNLYRLEVRLGDAKDMVNVSVRFFKSPEISVVSSEEFFQFKELFFLSIVVKADPNINEIKTSFYSAESMTDCANTEYLEENRNANPSILKGDDTVSVLQGQALASGCYVFWASNQVGNDTRVFPFAVSKTKELFLVNASLDNPYEGQELNITCQVNSFSFDDPVWFVKHENQFIPVTSGIDRSVISTTDGHTRSATIHFASLSLEDSGVYKCQSLRHLSPTDANRTEMEISLDVMELTAPVFLDNATDQVVEEDDDLEYLNCTATGGPSFNVTWYKGSEQLNVSEYPGILDDNPFLLKVQCIELEDSNITLTCEVSNQIGSRTKRFHLITHVHYREIYRMPDDLGYGIDSILYISLGLGIPFLLVLLGAIIVFRHTIKSRSNDRKVKKRTFRKGPQPDESNIPFDINWEFPTNRLTMGPKIGQGAFGKVVRAEAAGIKEGEDVSTVAVKMLKPGAGLAQKRALLEELKILILLGRHVNIVNLLGAVTKYMNVKGELLVIVENCSRGSLRQYLIRHKKSFVNQLDPESEKVNPEITTVTEFAEDACREQAKVSCSNSSGIPATSQRDETDSQPSCVTGTQEKDSGVSLITENTTGNSSSSKQWIAEEDQEDDILTTSDLLAFAFQCSRGMEYLASRKLVHRDLATRNILLTSDYVIKICDFGLTKDVDYLYNRRAERKNTPLPIRWMAPEAIGQNEFTIKSDVWSFGVVLWEMFSLGLVPYPGMEINEQFYRRLLDGYRLDRPRFAPQEIYSVMTECWRFEMNSRPNFVELSEKLGAMIENSTRQYYLDLNEPFEEQNGRDPNYQKLGEILEISVARGDDLGDLCGLPSLDQIEEEEEIRNPKQRGPSDASSASEVSDDENQGEEETIHGESGLDRKLVRKVSNGQRSVNLSIPSQVNCGFDCALPCDGNVESEEHDNVELESLERQVYHL